MPQRFAIALRLLFVSSIFLAQSVIGHAQSLPSYCVQVSQDQVGYLPHPYTAHQGGNHSSYCEGMLSTAAGVQRVTIASIKNAATTDFTFVRGASSTLSWCKLPGVDPTTHLSLRSIDGTSYALDAQSTGSFTWNSDLAALLHPQYQSIGALATASMKVQQNQYAVLLPVYQGASAKGEYVFIVHSPLRNIQLVEANVQNMDGSVNKTIPIKLEPGPPEYWSINLSLATLPTGIYRLFFRDNPSASALSSTPIFFGHGGCQ
jgi:hypothetical protein